MIIASVKKEINYLRIKRYIYQLTQRIETFVYQIQMALAYTDTHMHRNNGSSIEQIFFSRYCQTTRIRTAQMQSNFLFNKFKYQIDCSTEWRYAEQMRKKEKERASERARLITICTIYIVFCFKWSKEKETISFSRA